MPNWCYNEEYIYGPKPQVKELYEKLIDWSSRKYEDDNSTDIWLYKIALGAGFSIDTDSPDKPGIYFRGYLLEPFEFADYDNDNAVIRFSSDTAWGNFHEEWDQILAKVAPECKYYFIAIEPGSEIYIKRDPLELFPESEWYVDIYIDVPEGVPEKLLEQDGCENWWLESDLVHYLRDLLDMESHDIHELVGEFYRRFSNGAFGSQDNCYSFNKIEEIQ